LYLPSRFKPMSTMYEWNLPYIVLSEFVLPFWVDDDLFSCWSGEHPTSHRWNLDECPFLLLILKHRHMGFHESTTKMRIMTYSKHNIHRSVIEACKFMPTAMNCWHARVAGGLVTWLPCKSSLPMWTVAVAVASNTFDVYVEINRSFKCISGNFCSANLWKKNTAATWRSSPAGGYSYNRFIK